MRTLLVCAASALILGGCMTGNGGGTPADPSAPVVTQPVDPAASSLGALIAELATRALGPAGGAIAAIALPWLWKRLTGQSNQVAAKTGA